MLRPGLIATLALLAGAAAAPAPAHAAPEREIVLKRAPGLTAAERAELRAGAGVALAERLPLAGVEVVTALPGERAEALAELRADPGVEWAEPNRPRSLATADPYWTRLWGLENTGQTVLGVAGTADADIDAPEAWAVTRGRGATVAVVDTGIAAAETGVALVAGRDFVDGDATPVDGNGHGTHVAGTIAAQADDRGVVGVAPAASVMALRALDDTGAGWSSDTAAAYAYAGDLGVRVVNASLGAAAPSQAEYDAIAAHPDTLYVVAAGNEGSDNDAAGQYPCGYDLANVVCIGASDATDRRAPFSNFGARGVDLFAPGVNVLSGWADGTLRYSSGTSMATPHAAGAAALLVARDPSLSALQLKRALLDGAEPKAALSGLAVTGGRLNAARSLASLTADDVAPAAPGGLTATGADGTVTLAWAPGTEDDLAGYRVYRVEPSPAPGPEPAPAATPAAATVTVAGLAAATEYGFRVTAVDAAGNESAASPVVRATTSAAPPLAAGPSSLPAPAMTAAPLVPVLPAPAPASAPGPGSAGAAATIAGLRLSGRAALGRRSARLSFTLGAAATVRLSLQRRSCTRARCRWSAAGSRTLRLAAGPHALTVGTTLAGLRLGAGSWRVTVATAVASRQLALKVSATR